MNRNKQSKSRSFISSEDLEHDSRETKTLIAKDSDLICQIKTENEILHQKNQALSEKFHHTVMYNQKLGDELANFEDEIIVLTQINQSKKMRIAEIYQNIQGLNDEIVEIRNHLLSDDQFKLNVDKLKEIEEKKASIIKHLMAEAGTDFDLNDLSISENIDKLDRTIYLLKETNRDLQEQITTINQVLNDECPDKLSSNLIIDLASKKEKEYLNLRDELKKIQNKDTKKRSTINSQKKESTLSQKDDQVQDSKNGLKNEERNMLKVKVEQRDPSIDQEFNQKSNDQKNLTYSNFTTQTDFLNDTAPEDSDQTDNFENANKEDDRSNEINEVQPNEKDLNDENEMNENSQDKNVITHLTESDENLTEKMIDYGVQTSDNFFEEKEKSSMKTAPEEIESSVHESSKSISKGLDQNLISAPFISTEQLAYINKNYCRDEKELQNTENLISEGDGNIQQNNQDQKENSLFVKCRKTICESNKTCSESITQTDELWGFPSDLKDIDTGLKENIKLLKSLQTELESKKKDIENLRSGKIVLKMEGKRLLSVAPEPEFMRLDYKRKLGLRQALTQTEISGNTIDFYSKLAKNSKNEVNIIKSLEKSIILLSKQIKEIEEEISEKKSIGKFKDQRIIVIKKELKTAKEKFKVNDELLSETHTSSSQKGKQNSKKKEDERYEKLEQLEEKNEKIKSRVEELQQIRATLERDIEDMSQREKPEIQRLSKEVDQFEKKMNDSKIKLRKTEQELEEKLSLLRTLKESREMQRYKELILLKKRLDRRVFKWKSFAQESKTTIQMIEAFSAANSQKRKVLTSQYDKVNYQQMDTENDLQDVEDYEKLLCTLLAEQKNNWN